MVYTVLVDSGNYSNDSFSGLFFLYIDLNDSDVKTVLGNPMLGGCWRCLAALGGASLFGEAGGCHKMP